MSGGGVRSIFPFDTIHNIGGSRKMKNSILIVGKKKIGFIQLLL